MARSRSSTYESVLQVLGTRSMYVPGAAANDETSAELLSLIVLLVYMHSKNALKAHFVWWWPFVVPRRRNYLVFSLPLCLSRWWSALPLPSPFCVPTDARLSLARGLQLMYTIKFFCVAALFPHGRSTTITIFSYPFNNRNPCCCGWEIIKCGSTSTLSIRRRAEENIYLGKMVPLQINSLFRLLNVWSKAKEQDGGCW